MSEHVERIESYLQGLMSDEEKKLFEEEMHDDVNLRNEVEKLRIIDAALEVSAEEDLRSRLKQLEAKSIDSQTKTSVPGVRNLYPRLAAAAGILLLISAGLWFLIGRGSDSLHQFGDQHYLGYDYTQMRGEYSSRSDFPVDINSKNYDRQKALKWFTTWLDIHPDDDEARFILANIFKDMKQTAKAKDELIKIIAHHSILWGEKAEWNYLLLSSTDTWDDLARSTLQKMIQDPAHSYHQQAIQLDALMKK